jgi:hypothetical protein
LFQKADRCRILQSAENRRAKLMCCAVPEGVGCETDRTQYCKRASDDPNDRNLAENLVVDSPQHQTHGSTATESF